MHPFEAFLSGPSASYVEDMYASWLKDPLSVHVSWQVRLRCSGIPIAGHPWTLYHALEWIPEPYLKF